MEPIWLDPDVPNAKWKRCESFRTCSKCFDIYSEPVLGKFTYKVKNLHLNFLHKIVDFEVLQSEMQHLEIQIRWW